MNNANPRVSGYKAQVTSVGEGKDAGTYGLDYVENGTAWGDYSACPREEIRMAGAKHGGETLLILAAENNATAVASALLLSGADVDARRTNGDTALAAAATHSFHGVVGLLLRHQARDDVRNFDGETPLLKAAGSGGEAGLGGEQAEGVGGGNNDDDPVVCTVRLLLGVPGAVERVGPQRSASDGASAVAAAARANRRGCLDALLDAGLDPDLQTRDGDTAIMITARFKTHFRCSKVCSVALALCSFLSSFSSFIPSFIHSFIFRCAVLRSSLLWRSLRDNDDTA